MMQSGFAYQGFTLIELILVVAIIGILALVITPAYNNYVIRGRVVNGLNLARSAQVAVADTTMVNNILPPNQSVTGYTSPTPTVDVASIVMGANGIITITYTAKAGGGTIILQPTFNSANGILGARNATTGALTWTCTGGTLNIKYRPQNCRP